MKRRKNRDTDRGIDHPGRAATLPDGARLACAYELFLGPLTAEVVAFFHRTDKEDELWLAADIDEDQMRSIADGTASPEDFRGRRDVTWDRVADEPIADDEPLACSRLLAHHLRGRFGVESPRRFLGAGIIDKVTYDAIVQNIEGGWEDNRAKAAVLDANVIQVARQLGLNPRPSGADPTSWLANCPGRGSHVCFISPNDEQFTCPWCKRKGGANELRAFVKEREALRAASSAGDLPPGAREEATEMSASVGGRLGPAKRQPSAATAWRALEKGLALALHDLGDDQFLVISYKRANYFVQFAGKGSLGMRAEASSDIYIIENQPPLLGANQLLEELGWGQPTHDPKTEDATHPPEGSPNFYLDLANPVDYPALAGLAITTLRQVYGLGHPGELEYKAFGEGGISIGFPMLAIKRAGL